MMEGESSRQDIGRLAPFKAIQPSSDCLSWPAPCKASPWWVPGRDMVLSQQEGVVFTPRPPIQHQLPLHIPDCSKDPDWQATHFRNSHESAGVGKALHPEQEAEGRTVWGWEPEYWVQIPAVTWTGLWNLFEPQCPGLPCLGHWSWTVHSCPEEEGGSECEGCAQETCC